jgi:hypothetical protein
LEDSDREEDDDEEISLFDIAFTIEVYNREGVLETTLRPALTRTTRKVVVQAKVSRSPCYVHVNPQLAAVMTLGESVWKGRDNAGRIVAWHM